MKSLRAWDDVAQKMLYAKPEQFDDMLGYRFDGHFETDKPVYMWGTGKKDEEKNAIFDGDNLYAPGNLDADLQYVGTVEWDDNDNRWEVSSLHGRFEYIPDGCVVRGNIYEVEG